MVVVEDAVAVLVLACCDRQKDVKVEVRIALLLHMRARLAVCDDRNFEELKKENTSVLGERKYMFF